MRARFTFLAGSRLGRFIRFAAVGAFGLAVNQAVVWAVTEGAGVHYVLSAVVATQISTGCNFVLTEAWVFGAASGGRWRRVLWFFALNNGWLAARVPMLLLLTGVLGMHYLLSNLVALLLSSVARFVVSDVWIWRLEGGGRRPSRFHYDVHGIVRISSEARLPELAPFGVAALEGSPDLEVTIGCRGFGGFRRWPLVLIEGGRTTYVEHLGALGFCIKVDMTSSPARIHASRFLRSSPHVLYTNVVEPTLRWMMVRKGYILAHAACLELEGRGLLITAQTDTGKTTTCLRSIRSHGAAFVSDDMTILAPDSVALTYPKPLTISAHTLQAASAAPMPWWRKPWLQVQSRLHSKSGRRLALWLAKHNLPVATINGLVQMVVPPPKFFVEQLIPAARKTTSLSISHMVVIERGPDLVRSLTADESLRVLSANTEDAYGFPPYPLIAEGLKKDHAPVEERIRRRALERVSSTLIRTQARDWCERLPDVVRDGEVERPIHRIVTGGAFLKATDMVFDGPVSRISTDGRRTIATDGQESRNGPARLSTRVSTLLGVLAIAGILAVAVALRISDLGKLGFTSDEAVYSGQAAALAGDEELGRYFSPFRAHPLLMQTLLAVLFRIVGVSDVAARTLVALAFGVGGVAAVMLLARRLYGWAVALIAGLLLALVPYHVTLSRQVMLDVALALAVTLTLGAAYRFVTSARPAWLLMTAPLAGVATLTKETGVLLIPTLLLYFVWVGRLRSIRLRLVVAWGVLFALTVLPFVATRLFFEAGTTQGYLLYQLLREPNHAWWYFPVVLWVSLGPLVVLTAVVGLASMISRRSIEDRLLLSWLIVFGVFFQLWPTKLFPYLVVIAPPIVMASAHGVLTLATLAAKRLSSPWPRVAALAATLALAITLLPPSIVAATQGFERLEGPFALDVEVQDFAGGREVARWIGENTPEDSVFLTLGPSMGNIVSFYGHRDWFALSVNRDPRKRNPAYRPIINPDLEIRRLRVQYAIWDAYSADRSAFYNASLMRTVRRHQGIVVFAAWLGSGRELRTGREPPPGVDARIVVYSLAGGDPLVATEDELS